MSTSSFLEETYVSSFEPSSLKGRNRSNIAKTKFSAGLVSLKISFKKLWNLDSGCGFFRDVTALLIVSASYLILSEFNYAWKASISESVGKTFSLLSAVTLDFVGLDMTYIPAFNAAVFLSWFNFILDSLILEVLEFIWFLIFIQIKI